MARDWIKLYTRILDDADINGLSAETGWLWTRMMVLAGRNEDNGRIGAPKNVAYVLHTSMGAISAAVEELDGRVTVSEDGELWFRDWQDWQSQSERERQRSHRAGKAAVTADDESESVTTCHDLSRPVTDGHVYERRSRPDQTETTSGAAAAAPAPRELPIDDQWVPVCEALAGLYGGVSWRDRRTGERLAWVGQSVGILGKHCGADPARALVAVAKFKASDRAKFAPKPRDLPPVLGQWCEAMSPKRADDGAAFDERYHARLDGGRVVLRDPSLTIAALGLACNPHDPATWPPDMRAAYAARIHVADGREVFA